MCKVEQHCGNKGLSLEKVKLILTKLIPHSVISLVSSKNGKGSHSRRPLGLNHRRQGVLPGRTVLSPTQALEPDSTQAGRAER